MQGWHAKKYANKVGMMHESKVNILAKPHHYIFFTPVRHAASLRAESAPIHAVVCCIFTCLRLVKIRMHTRAISSHIAFSTIKTIHI